MKKKTIRLRALLSCGGGRTPAEPSLTPALPYPRAALPTQWDIVATMAQYTLHYSGIRKLRSKYRFSPFIPASVRYRASSRFCVVAVRLLTADSPSQRQSAIATAATSNLSFKYSSRYMYVSFPHRSRFRRASSTPLTVARLAPIRPRRKAPTNTSTGQLGPQRRAFARPVGW